MADGSDLEKTEEATPRRREEARKDGQIARSQELTTAGLLLATAMAIQLLGPSMASGMREIVGTGLTAAGSTAFDAQSAVELIRALGWRAGGVVLTWMLVLAGAALAVNALQARGILTSKPLAPKFERINPAQNIKRIVGAQALVELVKSLAKLLIVGLAVRSALGAAWPDFMALPQGDAISLGYMVQHYAVKLLLVAGLAYLVLAIADYAWQLWRHEQQLKMSKQDIKQEMKESDGDPLVKQRMRSMGRALARKQMFRDVPKADVVITNPTHIAVAIKYDPLAAPAPIVLAMGQRKVAERIKKIAKEHGIPTIENKPLARALLAAAKVGTMIPVELYLAVAEILAFVIRRRIVRGSPLKETIA